MGGGGGGWGKKQKKIHARENAKKKNSCKEEGKEKKFMQKEGPIVIFIRIYKICQVPIKKSSYSKYSWGPTPGPPILLIINKDI